MKPYVIFTRSDGRTFRVDDNLLGLTKLEGLGKPTIEIFTEKRAVGNGDVVTGKRVGSRLITVAATARVSGENASIRDAVGAFFHSSYTYDVECHYDGLVRTAEKCEIKAVSIPTDNIHRKFRFSITVLCPSGFLAGGGLNGQNINAVRGGFGFPYVSLVGIGFNAGVFLFEREIAFFNDGSAPTDLKAVLTARGTVKNPAIYHGEHYVRVLTDLVPGDRLEIDVGNRSVRLNGQNAITKVDRHSNFEKMQIQLGENTIGFAADSGDNLLDVSIYWAKQYELL